eukprot:TRINITY_DN19706_c0_g1_i7.p1 TRINITY_DN19706_c0_g1~~TRINITY_DN19706_c0_g1_i7.p1  ORF type:complete len:100 (-),score=8.44 TRINITY_DN19706_c0_g1_i7:1-300(-)
MCRLNCTFTTPTTYRQVCNAGSFGNVHSRHQATLKCSQSTPGNTECSQNKALTCINFCFHKYILNTPPSPPHIHIHIDEMARLKMSNWQSIFFSQNSIK